MNPGQGQPSFLLRCLPGLSLFRDYRRQWLPADLMAGVTVCLVSIPSVIAYAQLMGLPPQHGLYAALIPLLVYPLFGSSRQVTVGPDITTSLMVASAIAPLAAGNAAQAAVLAAAVAVLTGLLLLLGAQLRIGGIANFLSKPVLVGYMTGAALILIASQLDRLFGVKLEHTDFFPRLGELASQLHLAHAPTLMLGLGLLGLILLMRWAAPKLPSALVVVAAALLISLALNLQATGVAVVGVFPRGLPAFATPGVGWHEIHMLLPAAVGIALLTYTQGILLARAFGTRHGYEVNSNQELAALGVADLCTGLFQGFPITGSQSRTAINDSAGAKSQVASLAAGLSLILFLVFLTPLIAQLPVVALAALLVYGGFTLVEFVVMFRIYRYYPRSAVLAALTTLGVLAVGVVPGILIGVSLSLVALIDRISNPPDAVLRLGAGNVFHDLGDSQEGTTVPGFIAYRFYAPLLFSNASHFVQRVRELIAASPQPVRWFLVDAQAITDIDVTAAEALHGLNKELQQRGIALKFAHANRPLRLVLERIGFTSEIGRESIFHAVHEAARAFETANHIKV